MSQVWGKHPFPDSQGRTAKTFGSWVSTSSSLSWELQNKKTPQPCFVSEELVNWLFPCHKPAVPLPSSLRAARRDSVLSLKPNRAGHTEDGLLGSPFHFFNPAQSQIPPPFLPVPQGTLLYPPICSHSLSLCMFAHTADPAFIWKT